MELDNENGVDNDAVLVPSPEVSKLILHLFAVRSAVKVGVMLNEIFPTEESMEAFCNSDETIEGLQAFADARVDITLMGIKGEDLDPDALAAAVSQHHARAVEAVEVMAEQLMVKPIELFSFLLRA